jgi:hypothetical protein
MPCILQEETSTETRLLQSRDCREEAEKAVDNCLLTACDNSLAFESELALRSWLAGILIEEV